MERYKKAGPVALGLYFVGFTAVTFAEYPNIEAGADIYLATRLFLLTSLIGVWIWIKKDPYGVLPNLLVGVHIMLSCLQGQYFSPWYIFTFCQAIVAYSFLFPLPRRHFNYLLLVSTAAFLVLSLSRYREIAGWMYRPTPWDIWSAVIPASAVAWTSHHFFTADRSHREALVRKFGIIGIQAAGVVHDLKGMLAAPRMYVDVLKKKVHGTGDHELKDVIEALENQLLHITRAVTGLNQVVALQDQEKESFEIRQTLFEVADALNLSSRQVELEIRGNFQVYSEKALMKSILYNIFMNSVQAFRKNKIIEPRIAAHCDREVLTITDNGGGFPEEILSSIEKSKFRSFDGTGIGLFLVWNGVHSFGGDVVFSNTPEGAQVQISFVKSQSQTRRSLNSLFRSS